MKKMFCDCKSLETVPYISNWNTSNVNDMSYLFSGCLSLLTIKSVLLLPDISKWDVSKVSTFENMFYN